MSLFTERRTKRINTLCG